MKDGKLEFIQGYKGEVIFIYRTTKVKRFFKYGNMEFDSMKDAKAEIDKIEELNENEDQHCVMENDSICHGCGDCEKNNQ